MSAAAQTKRPTRRLSRKSVAPKFCPQCSGHSPLTTRHCIFNRQPARLEIIVTHTKQRPAQQVNRQLSGTLRTANCALPVSGCALRGSRRMDRGFRITNHPSRCLPPGSLRGAQFTTHVLSNRNNAAFKISRNSMKIQTEPISNRNTNQDIAAVATSESICNNADAASIGIPRQQRDRGICFHLHRGNP